MTMANKLTEAVRAEAAELRAGLLRHRGSQRGDSVIVSQSHSFRVVITTMRAEFQNCAEGFRLDFVGLIREIRASDVTMGGLHANMPHEGTCKLNAVCTCRSSCTAGGKDRKGFLRPQLFPELQ